jgi:hypothetical protein
MIKGFSDSYDNCNREIATRLFAALVDRGYIAIDNGECAYTENWTEHDDFYQLDEIGYIMQTIRSDCGSWDRVTDDTARNFSGGSGGDDYEDRALAELMTTFALDDDYELTTADWEAISDRGDELRADATEAAESK